MRGRVPLLTDAVLLLCRLPGCAYRFYGRLGYVSHEAEQRPIRFVFRLRDSEELQRIAEAEALAASEAAAGET